MPENLSPETSIVYSVFAVGDMGALSAKISDPVLESLQEKIHKAGEKSAMFFLGDNIYPRGLPLPDDHKRERAEDRINAQINILKDYPGRAVFISGNHDWDKGRAGGWEYVKRQEIYVTIALQNTEAYLPHNGCPGPCLISAADNLVIIIINTQWWIQYGAKPKGAKDGCSCENEDGFFATLAKMLDDNKGKRILVVAHHPLYSNALHGGNYTIKQHLFPFTDWKKNFYFPALGIGSLYLLYRTIFGVKEDISYPSYRRLRKKLLKLFKDVPGLVYMSGHDHNLQYIKKGKQHFIISGSGSKAAYVKKGGQALFAAQKRGFFRFNILENSSISMECWALDGNSEKVELVYEAELESK